MIYQIVCCRTETSLQKHMRGAHGGESVSLFTCEVCSKTFQNQKNLVQHMKLHQGLTKQYKCSECPAAYSYKCHLTRHLMIHTGEFARSLDYVFEHTVKSIYFMKQKFEV